MSFNFLVFLDVVFDFKEIAEGLHHKYPECEEIVSALIVILKLGRVCLERLKFRVTHKMSLCFYLNINSFITLDISNSLHFLHNLSSYSTLSKY
jgi:hypothetical protein